MEILNLTEKEKCKCFTEFKTRCYFVYRTYIINKILFEEHIEIYGEYDSPKLINNALVDHILLQFHIITDSANFRKEDKNLSIFFFLEWSWAPEIKSKLEDLGQKLKILLILVAIKTLGTSCWRIGMLRLFFQLKNHLALFKKEKKLSSLKI